MRLTRSQINQIDRYLQAAIRNYDFSPGSEYGEHYDYVSTLLTHIQADFWQLLMELPLEDDERDVKLAELKAELKKTRKLLGRASQTIGSLRRDLGLARLYRTCWAEAQASDCSACRTVFADEPARTPVVGTQLDVLPDGALDGLQRTRSRIRPQNSA